MDSVSDNEKSIDILELDSERIAAYNASMKERMHNPYEYHPEKGTEYNDWELERPHFPGILHSLSPLLPVSTTILTTFLYHYTGLYYHYVSDDIIVGSQPRTHDDIDHIVLNEKATTILNLQEDRDLHNWAVDLNHLSSRASHHGASILRTPATDFDEHSLRAVLPKAVAQLQNARSKGRVYVHCTAGLGRSPAVAIAALYWFTDMQLDEAYGYLTSIRPCGPKREAIRGATFDLLSGRGWHDFFHEPSHAFASLNADDRARLWTKLPGLEV